MYDKETLIAILSCYSFPIYRRIAIIIGIPINEYCGDIFEPMQPSTLTMAGLLTGVALDEKKDVGKFWPEGDIILVGSLYEENWLPGYEPLPASVNGKPRRGRKPKIRERKRAIRGNGKYFASQITFQIKSRIQHGKVYKFKVFRTGKFQVPGVLDAAMKDLIQPLETLRSYFCKFFGQVTVTDIHPQMRNMKTVLSDLHLHIHTERLGKALIAAKERGENPLDMDDVKYITDKSSAKSVVKFKRPNATNTVKKSTLKILSQKLNYEGALDLDDILLTHEWINEFILDNYGDVIIDPNIACTYDESSDDEEIPTPIYTHTIEDDNPDGGFAY